ncbi:glycosyltransferase [Methylicorpusculum oleiharenae]|uniref:glycosyltransferase family 2 protein n=1 Tax=Methylicorpusculum oleiharenae TaxID=1338687 RepID=UPI00135A3E5B|nr:glycosyltransferase family 2 protein [Methylicorpusculum oleiharenae]MCD2448856.1 glycosyltransferase [Methylicorpusculum oleiharenae]
MSKRNSVKVSVIIPTFNAEPYIKQALESVINQTETDLEVIVCDDLSTDNTVAVVEGMVLSDCRIKLIKNNQNQGPSCSRNRAISEANGFWIALLDADDFYHPERLNKLIEIAELNNADLVADNVFYVDINGQNPLIAFPETTHEKNFKIISVTEFIANDFPIKTGFNYGYLKPIVRRSFLKNHMIRYDEHVRLGEDFMLYTECLLQGAIFVLTNQPYYYYRRVPQSLSRTGDNTKYQELRDNNLKLINSAKKVGKMTVVKLLEKRQKRYDKLMLYYDIVRLIKQWRFYSAAKKLITNPKSWITCVRMSSRYLKRIFLK